MIARHWTGVAKKDKAADYISHLQNDTFKKLQTLDGFLQAHILKREIDEGIEFLIVTEWRDMQVIGSFAGTDVDTAVVPDLVKAIMIRYDEKVRHYEISFSFS